MIYEGYKIDEIVVRQFISIMHLKATILAELGNNEVRKDSEIGYVVEGNSCPLQIKNDVGVKLYSEVK